MKMTKILQGLFEDENLILTSEPLIYTGKYAAFPNISKAALPHWTEKYSINFRLPEQDLLDRINKIWLEANKERNSEIISELAPWPLEKDRQPTDNDLFHLSPWDLLAWYNPFHFHRENWGIEIKESGLLWLVGELIKHNLYHPFINPNQPLDEISSLFLSAAKELLFAHEFFHHQVESMATRLESVDSPSDLYIDYYHNIYVLKKGTDDLVEEALANAYMMMHAPRKIHNREFRDLISHWMQIHLPKDPPGYRLGPLIISNNTWDKELHRLTQIMKSSNLNAPSAPHPTYFLAESLYTPFHACRSRTFIIPDVTFLPGPRKVTKIIG